MAEGKADAPKLDDFTGVYDADQKALAAVFDSGSEKEQVDAAEGYIARAADHTGDAPARDLWVVTVSEA